ncbi:MAG: acetamidase/formamidase family protein [Eubacteriales bacterium]|nr:acetamidase/formamidase family protein [Eubacteriales bacterium]
MNIVEGRHVVYAFTPEMEPVLTVDDGSIVTFESNDCFFQQVKTNEDVLDSIDHDRLNPATGPVYVRGAEPGDLLKVDIMAIDVADQGVAAVVPGEGALREEAKEKIVRVIPIVEGAAEYLGLRIPLKPMIGVIGVAPSDEDGPCPTDTPYKHGGNMDTHDIRKGTTLYFPVGQQGGLFALGDCHALMGDGEVCFTGVEIPADVTVRLSVVKGVNSIWPILETETETMVIASAKTMEEATRDSVSQAVGALAKIFDCMWEEAYVLASMVVDARISQVVDPLLTVRAVIPKTIATTEQILNALKE